MFKRDRVVHVKSGNKLYAFQIKGDSLKELNSSEKMKWHQSDLFSVDLDNVFPSQEDAHVVGPLLVEECLRHDIPTTWLHEHKSIDTDTGEVDEDRTTGHHFWIKFFGRVYSFSLEGPGDPYSPWSYGIDCDHTAIREGNSWPSRTPIMKTLSHKRGYPSMVEDWLTMHHKPGVDPIIENYLSVSVLPLSGPTRTIEEVEAELVVLKDEQNRRLDEDIERVKANDWTTDRKASVVAWYNEMKS